MKLIVVILFTCLMQVSASSLAQRITISEKNASLEQVLKKIKQQTGFDILYGSDVLNQANKVNINLSNIPVHNALEQLFEGQPLDYQVKDHTIFITRKTPSFLERLASVISNDRRNLIDVTGRVLDEKGNPLPGASVKVKGKNRATTTNNNGEFVLKSVDENAVLLITSVGFKPREVKAAKDLGNIRLEEAVGELEQVNVTYNTGYQKVDPTKSTGSFVLVDSALFNRRVGTNVLDRLDGVTSGLIFNKNKSSQFLQSSISIRGRSTIMGNAEPLIVVDNFPYDGDINNINPNDIQDVTILRDASAASIWGTRSGNGVIVITTKRGKYNQPQKISFNSNLTIGEKPNVFYTPIMSSADYIEAEKYLFDKGVYDVYLQYVPYQYQSPVVDILHEQKQGRITAEQAETKLAHYRTQDVRKDIDRYINRNNVNQQYALNISGGSNTNQYYFSAGYDRNLMSVKSNSYDRFSLNGRNTYSIIKNKLELSTGIMLTKSLTKSGAGYAPKHPYERLADDKGVHLAVPSVWRQAYIDTAGNGKLLDWNYRPLDEQEFANNKVDLLDYNLNSSLKFKIIPGLNLNVLYQFSKGLTETTNLYSEGTYFNRNLVNQFSSINSTSGLVSYVIPKGSMQDYSSSKFTSHNLRSLLEFDRKINQAHHLSAIIGIERRTNNSLFKPDLRLYGYNQDLQTSSTLNFLAEYPTYQSPFSLTRIPKNGLQNTNGTKSIDNNLSYFGNFAYTYKDRYSISVSARRDESNIFGVNANQKGVPLWSAGIAWNIHNEAFYNMDFIPVLKFRVTQGYNGNVDKSTSAYVTGASTVNFRQQAAIYVTNPPNPELKWERIKMTNFAIDVVLKHNRLSGSLEYYAKHGKDIIGYSPLAPSIGINQFKGNTADINGNGIDLKLNSINFQGKLSWFTNLTISHAKDRVTNYKAQATTINDYLSLSSINPIVGKPVYSVFSYRWAGLDPTNGDPQVYLDEKITKSYSDLTGSKNLENLIYHGPANPTWFGNVNNTFTYKQISCSFNVTYKFGSYFRRNSLSYSSMLNPGLPIRMFNPDFGKRWTQAGDELNTNVPSLVYPNNSARSLVYENSEILVEKGDHIRLQDIRMDYRFNFSKIGIKYVGIYCYVNNLGILWSANKYNIDPDFLVGGFDFLPNPRSYSLGFNINF